jgi:LacI family transcriptional regulator
MGKRITLKDIAEEAGMSRTAVSLVLNDQPVRLSDENKRRIKQIAKKHGYHINQLARSLATQRTHTLGLLIPDIENPFFSSLAKRLEEMSRAQGYALLIVNSDDRSKADVELLEMLVAREVDGLLLVVSNEAEGSGGEVTGAIEGLTIPHVLVDRVLPGTDCDRVLFDNVEGSQMAVRHLLAQGHRRVACVSNTSCSLNGRERLEGYKRAMTEAGITIDPSWVIESDYHSPGGYVAADEVLSAGVTAVFSCSDMVTLGMLKRFQERGVRVPENYSVVSYDNSAALFCASPNITAVEQNIDDLSSRAFELLMRRMEDPSGDVVECVLAPSLIEKQSVRGI